MLYETGQILKLKVESAPGWCIFQSRCRKFCQMVIDRHTTNYGLAEAAGSLLLTYVKIGDYSPVQS